MASDENGSSLRGYLRVRVKTCSLMSWQMFHGQEQVISESLFLASRVDLRTISSSIANTMGNDLSGNVGSPTATTSASHDQDHPQSSLSLYQIASPIGNEFHIIYGKQVSFPVEFGLLGVDEFILKSIFYFRPRSFVSGDSQR